MLEAVGVRLGVAVTLLELAGRYVERPGLDGLASPEVLDSDAAAVGVGEVRGRPGVGLVVGVDGPAVAECRSGRGDELGEVRGEHALPFRGVGVFRRCRLRRAHESFSSDVRWSVVKVVALPSGHRAVAGSSPCGLAQICRASIRAESGRETRRSEEVTPAKTTGPRRSSTGPPNAWASALAPTFSWCCSRFLPPMTTMEPSGWSILRMTVGASRRARLTLGAWSRGVSPSGISRSASVVSMRIACG